mgnify:FL=1
MNVLERDLAKYLLKYGHLDFEVLDEKTVIKYNVADYIFSEMEADDLHFDTPVYKAIYDLFLLSEHR